MNQRDALLKFNKLAFTPLKKIPPPEADKCSRGAQASIPLFQRGRLKDKRRTGGVFIRLGRVHDKK
jgi:hypothetical protein